VSNHSFYPSNLAAPGAGLALTAANSLVAGILAGGRAAREARGVALTVDAYEHMVAIQDYRINDAVRMYNESQQTIARQQTRIIQLEAANKRLGTLLSARH
jgi:hypothetical protein